MSIIETCWGQREIIDKLYWHMIDASGASIFYNNVHVGKGALLSVSAGIEAEPVIHNAHTLYSLTRKDDEKEHIFEEVRKSSFPEKPSRLKTLYIFDDHGLVIRAQSEWFQKEQKQVYDCHILAGSVIHRGDTYWLSCNRDHWEENAKKYWRGEMSSTPFPEVLVHGALYFPGWKDFP